MKPNYFLLKLPLILLLFITSCSKDKANITHDDTLKGTWKLSESYIDIGDGRGKWRPVSEYSTQISLLTFKDSGVLDGSAYSKYVTYAVKDSITLTFYEKDKTEQNFRFNISNGVLTMSPSGPIFCIEGCGQKFRKLK